jgi:hypothetical protein
MRKTERETGISRNSIGTKRWKTEGKEWTVNSR